MMSSTEAHDALHAGDPARTREVLVDRLVFAHPDSDGALAALGALYVGDQLGVLRGDLRLAVSAVADMGVALARSTGHLARGLATVVDQVAPAARNGAGEVVGRTVHVAAAIRADQGAPQTPPPGVADAAQ